MPAVLLNLLAAVVVALATEMKYPKTLEQYEMVRAGLAADELAAAKNGATNLVTAVQEEFAGPKPMIDAAHKLAASESLDDARAAFLVISKELVKLGQGQPGFFAAGRAGSHLFGVLPKSGQATSTAPIRAIFCSICYKRLQLRSEHDIPVTSDV